MNGAKAGDCIRVPFTDFLDQLSNFTGTPTINETTPSKARIEYCPHQSACVVNMPPQPAAAKIDMILANLNRQTGLSFKREKRSIDVWVVRDAGDVK